VNPLLLTPLFRASEAIGTPIVLLHCWPFHREAGYLAQMFPHAYFDVGEALNYVGAQARQVVAESLEVAPFGKQLYSSDGWGPAELHYLGARLWRRAVTAVTAAWVEDGDWSAADARRVVQLIGAENARRIYPL
jgi:predicted TIM-barrel fold metal-dependent hydrolase